PNSVATPVTTNPTDGTISGTSGVINVAAGAIIDVSAVHTADRLAPIVELGTTNYQVVPGDQGGTVTFRAPLDASGTNVNVTVSEANWVGGARAVTLEAFKRWDLKAVANSGKFTGVTYDAATKMVTLDVTAGLDTIGADGTVTDTGTGLN